MESVVVAKKEQEAGRRSRRRGRQQMHAQTTRPIFYSAGYETLAMSALKVG